MKFDKLYDLIQENEQPVNEAGVMQAIGGAIASALNVFARFLNSIFGKERSKMDVKLTDDMSQADIVAKVVAQWNTANVKNTALPMLVQLFFDPNTHATKKSLGLDASGIEKFEYTPVGIGFKVLNVADQLITPPIDGKVDKMTYDGSGLVKKTEAELKAPAAQPKVG